jgi:hypothetical protein
MGLTEFLQDNVIEGMISKVKISKRLKDYEFEIKVMTADEYETIRKTAIDIKLGKEKEVNIDNKKFMEQIVIRNTIYPNFKNAEDIKKMEVSTPEQYLNKVLLVGEVNTLASKIMELSGIGEDFNDLVDEAKNE